MPDLSFAKINMRVRDLDAAVAYMTGTLGATIMRSRAPIAFGDMAMVNLGGLVVEIIAPASPESPLAQLIERRGEGIDSIGFMVDDVVAGSNDIEAAGGRMIGSQGGTEGDIAWMHPKNPLGLSLELLRRDFWNEAVKPR